MAKKPDQTSARTKSKAPQHLDVIPKGWFARDLKANSRAQGRFFVFRPETPDPDLHELESSGDAVDCQWTRHSAGGQTVYEVMLTAQTPRCGQTLKGDVALVARYRNVEEMVSIPYKLQSKSLAECVSETLWLGPVEKGESISRKITLETDPQSKIKVKAISASSGFQIHVHESQGDPNRIPVECVFTLQESGLRHVTIRLLARNSQGNEQTLELDYYAFVRP
jgi:hypothetical protein